MAGITLKPRSATMTDDPNMLTDAELDAVMGGLDVAGAVNTAVGALVGLIVAGLNALVPPVTLEVGPVTVTPSPK
jgi:hypothetical protein